MRTTDAIQDRQALLENNAALERRVAELEEYEKRIDEDNEFLSKTLDASGKRNAELQADNERLRALQFAVGTVSQSEVPESVYKAWIDSDAYRADTLKRQDETIRDLQSDKSKLTRELERLRAELAAADVRTTDAIDELDKLTDLLADSTQLRVEETPAIERLNQVIADLASTAKQAEPDDGDELLTDEWWCTISPPVVFMDAPSGDGECVAFVIHDDRQVCFDDRTMLLVFDDGSWGFWEQCYETGEFRNSHQNNFPPLKTRGDVYRLCAALGIDLKPASGEGGANA